MNRLEKTAQQFLDFKRIAVAGVSRKGDVAANIIYKKLRTSGYSVFPVNPNASEVEGDICYPDLSSIPNGVEGVVIATHPDVTPEIVKECGKLGIHHVWIHRAFGQGSLNDKAITQCKEFDIEVIPGSCPMMFCQPVDTGHKCIRWFLRISGKEPKIQD